MWNGLLPVGSVVLVKEETHRFMIIGHCVVKEADHSVVYDYSACEFPEGFQDGDHVYLFNTDQIEYVDCVGFVDERAEEWLTKMDDFIKKFRSGELQAD